MELLFWVGFLVIGGNVLASMIMSAWDWIISFKERWFK